MRFQLKVPRPLLSVPTPRWRPLTVKTSPFKGEPHSGPNPLSLASWHQEAWALCRPGTKWENPCTAGFDFLSVCCRWADNFVAPGCGGSQEHSFQHPFLQVSVPLLSQQAPSFQDRANNLIGSCLWIPMTLGTHPFLFALTIYSAWYYNSGALRNMKFMVWDFSSCIMQCS